MNSVKLFKNKGTLKLLAYKSNIYVNSIWHEITHKG